jgi:phosphoribosylformylglycinamidine cyclo-ligase
MSTASTYEKAGVSIAAGDALVNWIAKANPQIGGFAGLYKLNETMSLVACTDGVGTKLELSIAEKKFQQLGQDLVAMSVNDLICCGATPLFFLDYYACGKLDVEVAKSVIAGISEACVKSECVLLGGETAEMPQFYDVGKFDLAGFAVGQVENAKIINGSTIQEHDVIVGLPSSGFHANGYSLIRKILRDKNISLSSLESSTQKPWGELLTEPTALYVKRVKRILQEVSIKGMAHITGGGLSNIQRVLPSHLKFHVPFENIPTPSFMKQLQKLGEISNEEAFTVWNMGMGMALIVSPENADKIKSLEPESFVAGKVEKN